MKQIAILSVVGLLAAFPCYAQTANPTPSSQERNEAGLQHKLQQMSPEERREFLKNHPEIRERIVQHREQMLDKLESMTPDQRQQFLQNHPNLQQFITNHPKFAQKLANGSEAGAGIKDPGHPRVNEVNQREENQQQRIAQGVKSGSLTPQETARLEKGESRIQQQEADDLQKNNGHLTKAEDRRLNREENRESHRIHRLKHNQPAAKPANTPSS